MDINAAKRQKILEIKILKRFHKACADYQLTEDGDKILVAVSGGKDSLALIELLGQQSKIIVPKISVIALHVRQTHISYESDTDYLTHFCEQNGVRLLVKETSYRMLDDSKRSHCFMCSWTRRKMLFETAQELGCNKIALGHHKDDIAQTALLNLLFQGRFEAITPKTTMKKFAMTLIRPLCLIDEEDLKQLAIYHSYKPQRKLCPYEHETMRDKAKEMLDAAMCLNPNAKENIWHALLLADQRNKQ